MGSRLVCKNRCRIFSINSRGTFWGVHVNPYSIVLVISGSPYLGKQPYEDTEPIVLAVTGWVAAPNIDRMRLRYSIA